MTLKRAFFPTPKKMTQDDPTDESTEQKNDTTFSAKIIPCILIVVFGIFMLLVVELNFIIRALYVTHPASHPIKEDSVVEVIGKYEDGNMLGTWYSLLVKDSGTLKIINIEKGSRLGQMNPQPKYLIKSLSANGQATYVPITAEIKLAKDFHTAEGDTDKR